MCLSRLRINCDGFAEELGSLVQPPIFIGDNSSAQVCFSAVVAGVHSSIFIKELVAVFDAATAFGHRNASARDTKEAGMCFMLNRFAGRSLVMQPHWARLLLTLLMCCLLISVRIHTDVLGRDSRRVSPARILQRCAVVWLDCRPRFSYHLML